MSSLVLTGEPHVLFHSIASRSDQRARPACHAQASTLIGGLAGERTRWTEDSEKSADLKRRLVGDCALGSAFVSYCGPFNQEFRHYMVTDKFTADLQVWSMWCVCMTHMHERLPSWPRGMVSRGCRRVVLPAVGSWGKRHVTRKLEGFVEP